MRRSRLLGKNPNQVTTVLFLPPVLARQLAVALWSGAERRPDILPSRGGSAEPGMARAAVLMLAVVAMVLVLVLVLVLIVLEVVLTGVMALALEMVLMVVTRW